MGFYDSGDFVPERSFGFLVVSIASLLGDDLEAKLSEQLQMSLSQWRALAALNERRAVTAADLCAELRYDSGAMTRMIGKLEEQGWIAREDAAGDRRAYKLKLTRAGRTVCERGYTLALANTNVALAALTDAQVGQLIASLQTIKTTLLGETPDASTPIVRRRRG